MIMTQLSYKNKLVSFVEDKNWVSIFTEKTFNLQKEQPPIKCPATPTPSVKDIEKKLKVACSFSINFLLKPHFYYVTF